MNPNIGSTDTRDPLTQTFDRDWWAAQPSEIQAINPHTASKDGLGDAAAAFALHARGFLIDTYIVVWGLGPWLSHSIRTSNGIPFVVSMEGVGPRGALDPPKPLGVPVEQWAAMQKQNPGTLPTVYFDPADPDGTLRRLHAAYPPPAPAPKPAPVVATTNLVGDWLGGIYYKAGPGATSDTVKNNNLYTQAGQTFKCVIAGAQLDDILNHNFSCHFELV